MIEIQQTLTMCVVSPVVVHAYLTDEHEEVNIF